MASASERSRVERVEASDSGANPLGASCGLVMRVCPLRALQGHEEGRRVRRPLSSDVLLRLAYRAVAAAEASHERVPSTWTAWSRYVYAAPTRPLRLSSRYPAPETAPQAAISVRFTFTPER
jgi:hypothetical protein